MAVMFPDPKVKKEILEGFAASKDKLAAFNA